MVQLASKTVAMIDAAIKADGGNAFRGRLKDLLPKMDDAYRQDEKPYRKHLGASLIGRDCARELQLKWLWASSSKKELDGRILRLFNRGHLEEARFLAMLLGVPGIQVWFETPEGGQFRWQDFNGHYGSALDGIARGVPDLEPGVPCYCEFKTANDSSFKAIVKNGCRAEKYEHFVQQQQCMKYYKLPFSLYLVVNKNTDELYGEIIPYEKDVADQYTRRAGEIIFASDPMPRISNVATFFKCKFCDEKEVCHGKKVAEINCRTCCHWTAEEDGSVSCARNNDEVFDECAWVGCPEHVYNPSVLVGVSYLGGDMATNCTTLRTLEGEEFKQGPNHMTSQQYKERFTKC